VHRSLAGALTLLATTAALAAQAPVPPPQGPVRPDAQMPPITFRAEVNYVEVDAVVRDAQGAFVRDLKPEEFQVFEDGVPQAVAAFSLVDIPIVPAERAMFAPQEIEPDVRSNEGGPGGRLYVLLLDDLHTSFTRSARVREAARLFIERNLGANDLVAVIHTSGRNDAAQDFTSSRRLLRQAVDKFAGRKLRSAFLNKLDAYNRYRVLGSTVPITDPDDGQRLHYARDLLGTVKNLANWLSGIHGRRKAVILIGEGIDYSIFGVTATYGSGEMPSFTPSSDSGSSDGSTSSPQRVGVAASRGDGHLLLTDTKDALDAATRANVSIYAIDPRGLAVPEEEMITMSGIVPDDPLTGLRSTDLADELRMAQDSLRVLAGETGGFASVSSNDFAPALERIVAENSSYYMLGYYPTNDKRDGRFRRIDVRTTRPGLEVRARRGYGAPSGKAPKAPAVEAAANTSKELRAALDNPIPSSDFRFSLFAGTLKGSGKKTAVAIASQFRGQDIGFVPKGQQRANALEISYVAIDQQGKVAGGNRERVELSLTPETYERVMAGGFRLLSRFELAPGKYQLRVAAQEAGGRLGSVYYDLDVPDYRKYMLSMSSVVLSSSRAAAVPTAGSIPEVAEVLPGPPTTARTFGANEELAVLTEVYDNDTRQSHTVYVTTTLKAEGGSVSVFSNEESRSSRELGGKKGGYGFTTRIPLKGLSPGLYVLKVEAKSSLRDVNAVSREVQIRIAG